MIPDTSDSNYSDIVPGATAASRILVVDKNISTFMDGPSKLNIFSGLNEEGVLLKSDSLVLTNFNYKVTNSLENYFKTHQVMLLMFVLLFVSILISLHTIN